MYSLLYVFETETNLHLLSIFIYNENIIIITIEYLTISEPLTLIVVFL